MRDEGSSEAANANALPLLLGARAAMLVTGGLLVCSFVTTFFVGFVALDLSSRVPRPLDRHFDASTVLGGVLVTALVAVCLRASLRERARGRGRRGALPWTARLVPYVMALGGVGGLVAAVRAGGARIAAEEESARLRCEELGPAMESGEVRERCLVAAIGCGRARRPVIVYGDPELACIRQALGLSEPADDGASTRLSP